MHNILNTTKIHIKWSDRMRDGITPMEYGDMDREGVQADPSSNVKHEQSHPLRSEC